ncbi:MAG: UDP-N-acetylmuramoyl-L-alanine--D-glutamate ligase [Sedimentisphaerales bacterium]|nr:UDP-N-acetylmuramoyl-L-alanine--D-glutamate ligase [Sedimentisphaerales bacterium]
MNKVFFAGKKVLVMGLGRFAGGVDAAKFAYKAGAKVKVTDLALPQRLSESLEKLKDLKKIEYQLGSHETEDFSQTDIVIVNPAVEPENKFLEVARENNKFITSAISIFFQLCPAVIVGITGSNGKSTTAALAAHLLSSGEGKDNFRHRKVWLSGNIGNEPLLGNLEKIETEDVLVLELSSFQLEQLEQAKEAPGVSLLTNLAPNHLDRHKTFEKYCAAKDNIFKLQKLDENKPAISIFNKEDEISLQWFEKYSGQAGRICLGFSAGDVRGEFVKEFTLPGRANLSNLAGAITIAEYFGITEEQILNCLESFETLPHRLELISHSSGISWYNDSIATTPESSIAALEAFDAPIVLIAGGYDKGLSFEKLAVKISEKTRAVILIGQTAKKIAEAIERHPSIELIIEFADSLADAVRTAKNLAASGDMVLLSPACASYDMFDNFQQRGQEFVKLVRQIND